jgi:Fe-S-cluster containining protein
VREAHAQRSPVERAEALAALTRLHAEIDGHAAALAAQHGARLHCRRGCSACCVDGISVFAVEAERIRAHHAELLTSGEPHAAGACAFLAADGACRVYADRPYVCRTQGLPLRWIDEERAAELRDICPLNEAGEALETLPEGACWTLGATEARLAELQCAFGQPGERVALRALFERP